MKLIIQIPCLNEEATLPDTIRDLPKEIPGIDTIETLVVDDGSTDHTVQKARECGVHHILELGSHHGLAQAFSRGLDVAMAKGADIVVNTDADNQYSGQDICKLIPPILENRADVVVGSRPILKHPEFSPAKKLLQMIGSMILRWMSKTPVRDAASGFRAYSRHACLRMFLYSTFSYCMESLIQAGNSGLRVVSVDIDINPQTRPSRLFRNIPQYVWKQGITMLNMFVLYRPGRFFFSIGTILLGVGAVLGARFVYLVYITSNPEPGRTYLPSLILLAVLALTGFLMMMLGVLGELIKHQRRLTEEILYRTRQREYR